MIKKLLFRLQCITPPAESPGAFSVSLTVQNSINDSAADIFQPKLSYGEALNKTEFVYVVFIIAILFTIFQIQCTL